MSPNEVAHYEIFERRRVWLTSNFGQGSGGGFIPEENEPTVMVPDILRGAVYVLRGAVQRAAMTLGRGASAEDIIKAVGLEHENNSAGEDSGDEIGDEHDDEANFMCGIRLAMMDSLLRDYPFTSYLVARFTGASKSGLGPEDKDAILDLNTRQLIDSLSTFDLGAESDAAATKKRSFGFILYGLKSSLTRLGKITSCFVPDSDHSMFQLLASRQDTGRDNGTDTLHQEKAFRMFSGVCRSRPLTDVAVMASGFSMMVFLVMQEFYKSNERVFIRKFFTRLLPTGVWDGSIIYRTTLGCWAPATLAYNFYHFFFKDGKDWIMRRETLISHYRLAVMLFLTFLQRLDPPNDLKCLSRREGYRYAMSSFRFLMSTFISLISPLRMERHCVLEIIRITIAVCSIASLCSHDVMDVIIESSLGFVVHFFSSGLILWKHELDMRKDYGIFVSAKNKNSNI